MGTTSGCAQEVDGHADGVAAASDPHADDASTSDTASLGEEPSRAPLRPAPDDEPGLKLKSAESQTALEEKLSTEGEDCGGVAPPLLLLTWPDLTESDSEVALDGPLLPLKLENVATDAVSVQLTVLLDGGRSRVIEQALEDQVLSAEMSAVVLVPLESGTEVITKDLPVSGQVIVAASVLAADGTLQTSLSAPAYYHVEPQSGLIAYDRDRLRTTYRSGDWNKLVEDPLTFSDPDPKAGPTVVDRVVLAHVEVGPVQAAGFEAEEDSNAP